MPMKRRINYFDWLVVWSLIVTNLSSWRNWLYNWRLQLERCWSDPSLNPTVAAATSWRNHRLPTRLVSKFQCTTRQKSDGTSIFWNARTVPKSPTSKWMSCCDPLLCALLLRWPEREHRSISNGKSHFSNNSWLENCSDWRTLTSIRCQKTVVISHHKLIQAKIK